MIFYGVELAAGTVAQNLVLEGFTNTSIPGIAAPQAGRLIFNSDSKLIEFYDGTQWSPVGIPLPIASSTLLGGVKVGNGLAIDSGTGVLDVIGAGTHLLKTFVPASANNFSPAIISDVSESYGVITSDLFQSIHTVVLSDVPVGATHVIVRVRLASVHYTNIPHASQIRYYWNVRKNPSETFVTKALLDTDEEVAYSELTNNFTLSISFDTATNSFQYQNQLVIRGSVGPGYTTVDGYVDGWYVDVNM